ncbi:MAG: integrase arm-type DNA-binding domain-containing protein [Alphaproteobacteria bacterium]|nr:integrase arm-type DNA-binding domain-containing protein [Alphaproteobacteria bacterium]
MAHRTNLLTALKVANLKQKGLRRDGAGLYLRVKNNGGKFWVFRFMFQGKAHEMGLGSLQTISLADARLRAAACRKLIAEGKDPLAERDTAKAQAALAKAKEKTFKDCAEAYIEAHKAGWKNAKHAAQWSSTLESFAYPVLGNLPAQAIDLALVLQVIEPLWSIKTETANRLRGRIEAILDYAATRGYRAKENPARWKGNLDNVLPAKAKVQRVQHQPALPYSEIGDFMLALAAQEGTASKALTFVILTASRTSEAIGATWNEIDLKKRIWTIPANRIKAGREHRVPLSQAALDLLLSMQEEGSHKKGGYVFTSQRKDKPLSNMAMLALLKRMKRTDITVHGFRSTFRDWAAEQTNFPREVAEAALAHAVSDKVEAAYRRSDLFDKRRQLMEAWARYCSTPSVKAGSNVTPIRRKEV